jgi:hypothetical protein
MDEGSAFYAEDIEGDAKLDNNIDFFPVAK